MSTVNISPENIFVLDDNPDDLKLIGTIISRKFPDALLLLSETRDELFERLSWVKPDVIISDFRLRSCNGLDVLIDVKETADIPFIFCTSALDHHSELSESILNGANGYVLKDNLKDLPSIVDKVITKQAQREKEKIVREEVIAVVMYKLQRLKSKMMSASVELEYTNELKEIIAELEKIK